MESELNPESKIISNINFLQKLYKRKNREKHTLQVILHKFMIQSNNIEAKETCNNEQLFLTRGSWIIIIPISAAKPKSHNLSTNISSLHHLASQSTPERKRVNKIQTWNRPTKPNPVFLLYLHHESCFKVFFDVSFCA